ncbi:hypothetical protein LINGRAHAP2_LOCUS30745, partial [Linum grandiflorum]
RFLGKLKTFVGNKARSEGCIAEGWISEELFNFSSLYFDEEVETRYNRGRRVASELDDSSVGVPIGAGETFQLSDMEWKQAHRYVLVNAPMVEPFLQECEAETRRRLGRRTNETTFQKNVHKSFVNWFANRILNDHSTVHNEDLMTLARGPKVRARRYTAYDVNGYRFRTVARDRGLKTQNSGVAAKFGTDSVASSSDNNPIRSDLWYYGKL